jgi:hypothetical protein
MFVRSKNYAFPILFITQQNFSTITSSRLKHFIHNESSYSVCHVHKNLPMATKMCTAGHVHPSSLSLSLSNPHPLPVSLPTLNPFPWQLETTAVWASVRATSCHLVEILLGFVFWISFWHLGMSCESGHPVQYLPLNLYTSFISCVCFLEGGGGCHAGLGGFSLHYVGPPWHYWYYYTLLDIITEYCTILQLTVVLIFFYLFRIYIFFAY